ncbi:sensor histidine kinase [Ruixingdingia sedimenti]|uniref:histidine kinase n=1 Tax=Ruixingdingia sedimenti TaxID=3073604 RepID=A0ABU1FBB1_9RHOB|nr:HAMP domain-containing sensor histidine kinase [Xinfangfangia sp. LG-4]MDR5654184.1 HAMP domain-containing sensor histidine kinase [Xinfangfangia sp. LG-4]
MREGGSSIRLRLMLAALAAIVPVLALAALGLTLLFERQAIRLATQELETRANVLIAGFTSGAPPAAPPETAGGDPSYRQPYSGQYWQIGMGGRTWRSRSLWDQILDIPETPPQGAAVRIVPAPGPDGQQLLILDRVVLVGPGDAPVRITVATSLARFDEARGLFVRDVLPFLVALGLFLILASIAQVAIGLRTFARIGRDIEALESGRRDRLGRDMPREVRALAVAIDRLLDDRDRRVARARNRAADLAHTLKTPMQALLGVTAGLRARGEAEAAGAIEDIVGAIGGQLDRELGRARIGAEGTAGIAAVVGKIAAVLRRTARGDAIAIEIEVPGDLMAAIDPHDLTEAVGSLAENAMRHARTRVRFRAGAEGARVRLAIEDDGPGVPEDLIDAVARRGVRLDAGGTGLGLALAQDIMDAAGGDLRLANLNPGFCATLDLPRR